MHRLLTRSIFALLTAPALAQTGTLDGDELTSTLIADTPNNFWTGTGDASSFIGGSPGPELNAIGPFGITTATASLEADGTTVVFSFTADLVGVPIFLPCTLTIDDIDDRIAGATIVSPNSSAVDVSVVDDSIVLTVGDVNPLVDVFTSVVIELDLRPELSISESPGSTDVVSGERLELGVVLIGSRDDAQVRWLRDGVALANDNRISGVNTETLVIDPVVPADAGYYTFEAISQFGAFDLTGDTVGLDFRQVPQFLGLNNLLTAPALFDPPNNVAGDDAPLDVVVGEGTEVEKALIPATLAYSADFRNGSRLRFTQFVNDTINLPGVFTLTVTDIDTPIAGIEVITNDIGSSPASNEITLLSPSSFSVSYDQASAEPLADGTVAVRLLTEDPFIVSSEPALVAVRPAPGINPDVNNDGLVDFFDVLDLITQVDSIGP